MSEPTAEEIAAQAATAEKAKADAAKNAPIQLPDDHPLVKTLAAQKEAMKELKAKASRLDAIEEANKTELEKQQARADVAEKALADKTEADDKAKADRDAADALKIIRDEVAKAKDVPASALRGSTKEELETHADELLEFKGVKKKAPSADGQGENGQSVHGADDMSADDIVKAATGR